MTNEEYNDLILLATKNKVKYIQFTGFDEDFVRNTGYTGIIIYNRKSFNILEDRKISIAFNSTSWYEMNDKTLYSIDEIRRIFKLFPYL